MPRRKIPNTCIRTVRVHTESYEWIKEFFHSSPAGISVSDALREVIYQFGCYCKEQMDANHTATHDDLAKARGIVLGMVREKKDGDR